MAAFLDSQGVMLKDWKPYMTKMTRQLAAHVQQLAADAGRPYEYLADNHTKATGHSKEELARQIAERDGVTSGLICAFATVEPCGSFDVKGNRATHRLEIVRRRRKCRQFYLYVIDEQLGFCHVRLQSWFPFEIQVWAKGWRIKHRMGRNHVKVYDKGPVLRVETTINDPAQFRVLRVQDGHRKWCPMKKGVADLYRFYQVGRASDERYLEALAAARDNRQGVTALHRLCRPRRNDGRHHARLNPVDVKDLALFRGSSPASTPLSGSATPTSAGDSGPPHQPTKPKPNAAAPT